MVMPLNRILDTAGEQAQGILSLVLRQRISPEPDSYVSRVTSINGIIAR